MKSDIEIARSIELVKIKQIARDYDIPVEAEVLVMPTYQATGTVCHRQEQAARH